MALSIGEPHFRHSMEGILFHFNNKITIIERYSKFIFQNFMIFISFGQHFKIIKSQIINGNKIK